ncbi:MAG: chromosomal replication initiator protein DnaA [Fimbriimonadales bacterium]|nr:chromosomal replication initiator protein DnaA [Fimbriimonadales bacterium]
MSQQSLFEDPELQKLREAWKRVMAKLKDEVHPSLYRKFLAPLRVVALRDDVAVVVAPGQFVKSWVAERFSATIERMLEEEMGRPIRLQLEARSNPRTRDLEAEEPRLEAPPAPAFQPNERYRFETFIVGQSNRLAHAGAKYVAENPGKRYNPLFIYGPPGLGKTHLLHAIAHVLLAKGGPEPQLITAQQFAEAFVLALQSGRIEQFRRSQRNVGVWLVDDIQMIAGRDKTQEEVFHTFNALHNFGKQIVLTSDRPPRELLVMDERLRSRFESGLVADVRMPDTDLRCAILQSKAEQEGVRLDPEVAKHLAMNVPGSIRTLEGALNRFLLLAGVEEVPMDLQLAERVAADFRKGAAKPSFDQIVDAVAQRLQVPKEEILGSSRRAPIAHARHVAIYVAREITNASWKHLGVQFGNRDHTSMIHGYTKIGEMMLRDQELDATVRALIRDLYPEA